MATSSLGAGQGDELHIERQSGVAGHVQHAAGGIEHKTDRFAGVRAVGETTAVHGVDHLDAAKVERPPAPLVHRVGGVALGAVVAVYFPDTHDHGLRVVLYHRFHIGYVVAVRVGQQHEIATDVGGFYGSGQRIPGHKRVEQQAFAAGFHQKTGMAVVRDFHVYQGVATNLPQTLGKDTLGLWKTGGKVVWKLSTALWGKDVERCWFRLF
jgi:hypothetical protein